MTRDDPYRHSTAAAIADLAGSPRTRARLARGGRAAVRHRSREATPGRLDGGRRRATAGAAATAGREAG